MLSDLRFKVVWGYDVYVCAVTENFLCFVDMSRWYDEEERYAVDLGGGEQIVQHEREHCGAFLFGRYDLVQMPDHYVHFAFVEIADVFSVAIRQVRNWYCFNAFGCKLRQEERISSFEISNYSRQSSPKVRNHSDLAKGLSFSARKEKKDQPIP